jgi:hypothetical protein
MWIVHWLLGLSFYLAMSVSIWVEAAGMNPHQDEEPQDLGLLTVAQVRSWTLRLVTLMTPSLS